MALGGENMETLVSSHLSSLTTYLKNSLTGRWELPRILTRDLQNLKLHNIDH